MLKTVSEIIYIQIYNFFNCKFSYLSLHFFKENWLETWNIADIM